MRFIFVFVALLFLNFGYSQNALFSNDQFIEINYKSDQEFIYSHKLKAKETIYSLSRFFNQSVTDIYKLNGKPSTYVFRIDEIVRISFDPAIMTTDPAQWTRTEEKIAVAYQARPQDNLYRISREYFPQSMDHLMHNNKMQSFNLAVNQKLIIGYIKLNRTVHSSSTEAITAVADPVATTESLLADIKNTAKVTASKVKEEQSSVEKEAKSKNPAIIERLSKKPIYVRDLSTIALKHEIKLDSQQLYTYVEEAPEYERISKNGIALWDKKISDKHNLFVLHKSISPGTQIEVYYPLLQKSVHAQVVGNIPKGLYSKDVDLIISPKVAEKLGVRDAKFRVTVKYLKEVII